MQIVEFVITDRHALRQFEKLLGLKIDGDRVRLPQDVADKHANAITAIQMSAALRLKR